MLAINLLEGTPYAYVWLVDGFLGGGGLGGGIQYIQYMYLALRGNMMEKVHGKCDHGINGVCTLGG